jgi:hypothetical protein
MQKFKDALTTFYICYSPANSEYLCQLNNIKFNPKEKEHLFKKKCELNALDFVNQTFLEAFKSLKFLRKMFLGV